MSVFFDMFLPSRRHVEDERNRLEWTRDEEGEGDPHRGPIDLDSGVVTIKPADKPADNRADNPADNSADTHADNPVGGRAEAPTADPSITRRAASRSPRPEP